MQSFNFPGLVLGSQNRLTPRKSLQTREFSVHPSIIAQISIKVNKKA